MRARSPSLDPFRVLRRDLMRSRIAEIDPRLRIELLLIGTLISGFVFWQARVSFASLRHDHGPQAPALAVLVLGLLLAVTGGSLATARHRRTLATGPPGPSWLVLPIEPKALVEQLAWESRLHALWVLPFGAGILLAAIGLLPLWEVFLLVATCAGLLVLASRIGTRLALVAEARRAGPGTLDPLIRVLARPPRTHAAHARPRERWPHIRGWRALVWKDLLLTVRATAARRRAIPPVLFAIASLACWFVPIALPFAHTFALAFALLAAATLGEWLIVLAGEDPFEVVRLLPVGAVEMWVSRTVWALGGALALAGGHALAARALAPHAWQVFVTWTGASTLAVALLGVHYGLTLFPRAEVARRLYSLALGLSVAASLMIPLLGWIVLLAILLHSVRRLPRWSRLEDSA